MRIRHYSVFFLLLVLVFGMSSCSSTGYSTKTNLVVPETIRSPNKIPPELVQYLPRFADILQKEGFSIGQTEDPRALDLVMEFNGNPFNLRVSASLWREGIPILTASATNSGWGTALARGSAVESLADSAVSTFQSELTGLMSHTEIVPDQIEPEAARASLEPRPGRVIEDTESINADRNTMDQTEKTKDVYSELIKLDELRERGILTQAEFDAEKKELLENN